MIDLNMYVGTDPLSILGIFIALTAMTLGASYLYAGLDKKPLFSPTKTLAFLLGYGLLWLNVVGFWYLHTIIVYYWLAFFLISIPFSLDIPMRLTLSFSLTVIAVSVSIVLDHFLSYVFPPTYWVTNPLAVPCILYLALEGSIALYFFAWGWLWRQKNLAYARYSQLLLLVLSLGGVLFLHFIGYHNFFLLNEKAHAIALLSPFTLLILVLVLWVHRFDLSSTRQAYRESKIALAYLHKEIDLERERTESFRKIQHDFHHHLKILRQLLVDGQEIDARDYIDELIQVPMPASSSRSVTGNIYVDAVLHMKYQEAIYKELNLSWGVQGALPQKGYDDLALALANLLENAIRESAASSETTLSLRMNIQQGYFHLALSNSYKARLPRKKGRGQGLARKIFEKYQGELRVFQTEDTYEIIAIAFI